LEGHDPSPSLILFTYSHRLGVATVFLLGFLLACGAKDRPAEPRAPVVITAFRASPASVLPGTETTLTAEFSGGTGNVTPSIGPVISGQGVLTGPLTVGTAYTLRVTNGAGDSTSTQLVVAIRGPGAFESLQGSMDLPYYGYISAPLPDGKVLIGGWGGVELFDPFAGTFEILPATYDSRTDPAATPLWDGTVLVTGSKLAQVFNPSSRTFSPDLPMCAFRHLHCATLLADGRVLVTGGGTGISEGLGEEDAVASAEVYDPVARTFTVTGPMTVPRLGHTSTLLPGGKVLITGGSYHIRARDDIFYSQATAEIYDPATGTFTPTGSMAVARSLATSTLLPSGKVIVMGGTNGWFSEVSATATTERYDPASGTFTPSARMAAGRTTHTAVPYPDGLVLVIGGQEPTVEWYDATHDLFLPAQTMPHNWYNRTGLLLPTLDTLLVGGSNGFRSGTLTVSAPPPDLFHSLDPSPLPPLSTGLIPGDQAILAGAETTLTPWFFHGSGRIDPGVGPVASGVPVTVRPDGPTTFTLTVTGAEGNIATRSARIEVFPSSLPVIRAFTASPSVITAGSSTTLTWAVAGAQNLFIDQGVGDVTRAFCATASPHASTNLVLTAANLKGSTTGTAAVTVCPPPVIHSFDAIPGTVPVGGTPVFTALFEGGTGVVVQAFPVGSPVPILSGVPLTWKPLAVTRLFDLVVTNPAGDSVRRRISVGVK